MKLIYFSLIGAVFLASCGNQSTKGGAQNAGEPTGPLFDVATVSQEPLFDIETTLGTLRIKLYKETPGHRDNFVKLAADRYYNGVVFHRIIKGFMIQAGDVGETPTEAQLVYGEKGVSYTIPAEILPQFTHKRGALAAARTPNPEKASSGSQFYIVHTDTGAKHLDGEYTVYGEVVDGFDVLDTIANQPVTEHPTRKGEMSAPVTKPKILSITYIK